MSAPTAPDQGVAPIHLRSAEEAELARDCLSLAVDVATTYSRARSMGVNHDTVLVIADIFLRFVLTSGGGNDTGEGA